MIKLLPKRRITSVLGLSLDAGRLDGVVVRRTNGSVIVLKAFSAVLTLDPLTNEPELLGQEIRNILDKAGIRERRCAVCVPLSWALTHQTKVPDLPEADLQDLLSLEAERGFPYGPESLLISKTIAKVPGGEQYVTQIAVQRDHVVRLERALKAARLKPVTMSLGLSALQPPELPEGVLALLPLETSVALQVSYGGGVIALRSLEGAVEAEAGLKQIHGDAVAREIRITLGQMPAELRSGVQTLKIFGQNELSQELAEQLRSRVESQGFKLRQVGQSSAEELGVKPPPDAPISPAFALAARLLAGRSSGLEFLPPKVNPWQQFSARYSSRKLAWAGGAAAAVLLVVGGLFFYQHWQLSQLQSEWAQLSPKVNDLNDIQQQIRRFRPWFDNSMRNLSVLRRLTEAFPEEGTVTAKTIEIRELANVSCTGTARDNQALLRTLDQLRAIKEIGDVKVDQIRGKSPLQFTFNFHWGEKGAQQ
jgi:hypothetical protein